MPDTSIRGKKEKTKIFLLAGFLGSGKTTLLNHMLSLEAYLSDTVVLVNELGKIGIDRSIIRSKSNDHDVIELTSGCICCTLKSELTDTLVDIWERFKPKRILLEATGVAVPNSVVDILGNDFLKKRMKIEKIITVLDIRFWIGRETFGTFFEDQIQQADLVLLNKIDTMAKDQVQNALAELHGEIPGCHVVPTLYCKVDPELLWNRPNNQQLGNFYTTMPDSALCQECGEVHNDRNNCECHGELTRDHAGITYNTFDFVSEQPLNESRFQNFLKSLPWQLFRIKGPVRFPGRTSLLNYVAGQINWQKWDENDHTRLAFIGWDIDTSEMLNNLGKCVMKQRKRSL